MKKKEVTTQDLRALLHALLSANLQPDCVVKIVPNSCQRDCFFVKFDSVASAGNVKQLLAGRYVMDDQIRIHAQFICSEDLKSHILSVYGPK